MIFIFANDSNFYVRGLTLLSQFECCSSGRLCIEQLTVWNHVLKGARVRFADVLWRVVRHHPAKYGTLQLPALSRHRGTKMLAVRTVWGCYR
jgi:hypothetical protein